MSDTRYEVSVDSDGALVYVSREAGICGPAEAIAWDDLGQINNNLHEGVDHWLRTIGYARTTQWSLRKTYRGLLTTATLQRVASS